MPLTNEELIDGHQVCPSCDGHQYISILVRSIKEMTNKQLAGALVSLIIAISTNEADLKDDKITCTEYYNRRDGLHTLMEKLIEEIRK